MDIAEHHNSFDSAHEKRKKKFQRSLNRLRRCNYNHHASTMIFAELPGSRIVHACTIYAYVQCVWCSFRLRVAYTTTTTVVVVGSINFALKVNLLHRCNAEPAATIYAHNSAMQFAYAMWHRKTLSNDRNLHVFFFSSPSTFIQRQLENEDSKARRYRQKNA